MSDTTRLGISIVASGTAAAEAQIKGLQQSIKALESEISRTAATGIDSGGKYVAVLQGEIAAINQQIGALRGQAEAINSVTNAIRAQGDAASVAFRTLQQHIDATVGVGADRAIKSAAESARILATSLSSAAEADARLRAEALETAAALERQGAALTTLSGEQFFGVFERQQGLRQEFLSAAESAAVFQRELGTLGSAVETVSATGFNKIVADLADVKQSYLSAGDSAAVFARELGALGGAVQTTSTVGFNRVVSDLAAVKQSYLSASESAAVFERELGALGTAVQTTSAVGFNKIVTDLVDIKQSYLSAADSAVVFQRELGELGGAVTTTSAAGFSRIVDDLAGVKLNMLSAAESAAVFVRELGQIGSEVQTISAASFAKMVSDLAGVKQSFLSASESAAVFVREMGELGTAVQTISASGFSQMTADLAGVKQSYLSAAESAKVFQAAGLTAAETAAGMTEQSVAKAAMLENMMRRSGGGGGGGPATATREMRHVVAAFDELSRGQRGALFGTMGAAARDAGLGIAALGSSVVGLVAIMGTTAILRSAENMGEWATKTRAAASAAGMSIEAYSTLQGALTLTGVKATSADASLRRLAINLSTAIADPSSRAAEAFHNLGISQEELVNTGGDASKALKLMANAFTQTADSANKSAAMSAIFGRGFEEIIPALQNGSEGLQELENKARSLGLALTNDTANSLTQTGENVKNLGATIRGDGVKAFEEWSPAIELTVTALGKLLDVALRVVGAVGAATSAIAKFVSASGTSPTAAFGAAPGTRHDLSPMEMMQRHLQYGPPASLAGGAATDTQLGPLREPGGPTAAAPKRIVPPLTTPATATETMRQQMTAAALTASQGGGDKQQLWEAEAKAEIAVMKQTLATAKLTAAEKAQITSELQQKEISLNNQMASGAGSAARQSYQDFAASERLKISDAQGNTSKIIAIYDEWMKAAESKYQQSASVILGIERQKTQAINAEKLKQITEGVRLEEQTTRASNLMTRAQLISTGGMIYPHQRTIGGAQPPTESSTASLSAQAQAIQASAEKEIASLTEVMQTATQGSDVQKNAAQEILNVVTQEKQQELALYNKAAAAASQAQAKATEGITKFFDSLGTQFQSGMGSILSAVIAPQIDLIKQGLTTIKFSETKLQIERALSSLLVSSVQDATMSAGSMISKALASMLSSAMNVPIATGGGLGDLAASGVSKLFGVGTNVAAQAPDAATFGLAGTQLTAAGTSLNLAATTLNTAALALNTAAGVSGAGAAGAGAGTALAGQAVATTVGSTSSDLAIVTPIVSAIATSTPTLITGFTAALTSVMTTATTAIVGAITVGHPSILGFSFAGGGIVPSAAGGMVNGMGATLAQLHTREMVLPAHISDGLQNLIARGGLSGGPNNSANLNYAPTINTASRGRGGTGMSRGEFSQMMSLHSGALLGEARNMMRGGWRPA